MYSVSSQDMQTTHFNLPQHVLNILTASLTYKSSYLMFLIKTYFPVSIHLSEWGTQTKILHNLPEELIPTTVFFLEKGSSERRDIKYYIIIMLTLSEIIDMQGVAKLPFTLSGSWCRQSPRFPDLAPCNVFSFRYIKYNIYIQPLPWYLNNMEQRIGDIIAPATPECYSS